MILPLLLLILAAIPAAVIAYGIDPNWMQYPHGLSVILFARRFEWPLIALTLVLCVALLALVISGKKRAWWLVGLAPILTLLGHRFAFNPGNSFLVNADPNFVTADHAPFVSADDSVIGIMNGSDAVAFPYSSLYARPLVVCDLQTQPMMLLWSPFANAATAFRIDRSIRTNELEIVSMPANALLAYNSRIGQFINGLTGQTPSGSQPTGCISPLNPVKTTWTRWQTAHPATVVLAPPDAAGETPQRAVLPYFPMPRDSAGIENEATVALIRQPQTLAIMDADLANLPANFSNPPIVVWRDPVTGAISAFDRRVDEDLTPTFSHKLFKKFPQATLTDSDSSSAWTTDGRAIDGPLKGKSLKRIPIEDNVYWSIAKFWFHSPRLLAPN